MQKKVKKLATLTGSMDAASKLGENVDAKAINKMDNLCRENYDHEVNLIDPPPSMGGKIVAGFSMNYVPICCNLTKMAKLFDVHSCSQAPLGRRLLPSLLSTISTFIIILM